MPTQRAEVPRTTTPDRKRVIFRATSHCPHGRISGSSYFLRPTRPSPRRLQNPLHLFLPRMNPRFSMLFASLALAASALAQSPLQDGNLVVVRVGTGAAALSTAAQAVFLEELTTAGTAVQTIAMPIAASGASGSLVLGGLATSEGHLNLSPDARWLTLAGYNTTPGTASPSATASATTSRVIARINRAGLLDTTTQISNAFSAGTMRSSATDDGLQFWASGSNSGVQRVLFGATTAAPVSTGLPTNLRDVTVWNRQLYCSSASGTSFGVLTVGTGLPTSGASIAPLPGMPTSGISGYDHFFADANTLYLADDGAVSGGIRKYTLVAGTWTFQYALTPAGTLTRYLTGSVDQSGTVTLYATTTQTNANTIVSVVDAGAGSPFTTVATAPVNTVFRGVRVLRPRGSVLFAGLGSPTTLAAVPGIDAVGSPVIGNTNFAVSGTNFLPFGPGGLLVKVGNTLPFGIPLPGAQPGCDLYVGLPEDIFGITFADGTGNASYGLGLPNDPFFIGVPVGAQWLVLDPALPFSLPLATSRAVQLVLGR